MHLFVHVRVRGLARRTAVVEQPDARFDDDAAPKPREPRAHPKRRREAHPCSTGTGAMK